MKPEYKTVEFCCSCMMVFKAMQSNPERCSRCGSAHWQEYKKYQTKEGNGTESTTDSY